MNWTLHSLLIIEIFPVSYVWVSFWLSVLLEWRSWYSVHIVWVTPVLTRWSYYCYLLQKPVLKGPFVFTNIYRPQRSCEGYVFTRVCQSFCSQGVLSQHALQVVSQHSLQQGGACSRGCLLGRVWRTPPQKQTVADGTHPTGMHSCLKISWLVN